MDQVSLLESDDGRVIGCSVASLDEDGSIKYEIASDEEVIQTMVLKTKRRMMNPMLQDEVRNSMYEHAIREAVKFKVNASGSCKVLDIGAGTGLLSMMAAKCGATKVIGCEMNKPLASLAAQTVKENGLEGIVEIVAMRSTDLALFDTDEEKFDVIVTETLDSNLLTEGIVDSILHAKMVLAKPDVIVIPCSAAVYGQVFSCKDETFAAGINASEFACSTDGIIRGRPCESYIYLRLDPLSNLHPNMMPGLEPISEIVKLFDVEFGNEAIEQREFADMEGKLSRCESPPRVVLMWWDCTLFPNFSITTDWKLKETAKEWQDHWFPVVVPIPRACDPIVDEGTRFKAEFTRSTDDIVMTNFSIKKKNKDIKKNKSDDFDWVANNHMKRETLAKLADTGLMDSLREDITGFIAKLPPVKEGHLVAWNVSDSPLLLGAFGDEFKKVYANEIEDEEESKFWQRLVGNRLGNRFEYCSPSKFDHGSGHYVIVSDLVYREFNADQILPCAKFMKQVQQISREFSKEESPNRVIHGIYPEKISIKGRFLLLNRLSSSLKPPATVHQDYKHSQIASIWQKVSSEMFPVYLWCYEHEYISEPFEIASFDFTNRQVKLSNEQPEAIKLNKKNCKPDQIAFTISVEGLKTQREVSWHHQQLVYIFNQPGPVQTFETAFSMFQFSAQHDEQQATILLTTTVAQL